MQERDVIFEVRKAQIERINALNEFLVDVFVRTRKQQPAKIIIDLDPTDDPTHGKQQLSLFHGYYKQHQYFPMMIFEGNTGMPLGSWLRPGTIHASCGAVDMLKEIVDRLKAHWPDIEISVRGDGGLASPEMYEYCEAEKLQYAFGYSSNKRLFVPATKRSHSSQSKPARLNARHFLRANHALLTRPNSKKTLGCCGG